MVTPGLFRAVKQMAPGGLGGRSKVVQPVANHRPVRRREGDAEILLPGPDTIADLQMWHDPHDESTLVLEDTGLPGDFVVTMRGKAPTTIDFTQDTSSERPTAGTHTIGGRKVLHFDGGDFLTCTVNIGTSWTFLGISQNEGPGATAAGAVAADDSAAKRIYANRWIDGDSWVCAPFGITQVAQKDGSTRLGPTVWAIRLDNVTKVITGWENGVEFAANVYTGTPATSATALMTMGCNRTIAGSPFDLWTGKIGEWARWSRALTDDEIASMHAYFLDHAGLA